MRVSELKTFLAGRDRLAIRLPDGSAVPGHFHVTEVGEVTKHFVDCGGTVRHEKRASLQLWTAEDYDHRLHPEKLSRILQVAERDLGLGDLEIEVEFQGADTIRKFTLTAAGNELALVGTATACLALDACGLPAESFVSLVGSVSSGNCAPGSGCC